MTRAFSRRRLGLFWAVLLLGLGAGAATLQWLGPPADPVMAAEAVATPDPVATATAEPAAMAVVSPVASPSPLATAVPMPDAAAPPFTRSQATPGPAPMAVIAPVATPLPQAAAVPMPRPGPPPVVAAIPTPVSASQAPPSAPSPPPLGTLAEVARAAVADPVISAPDPQMLERSRHGLVPKRGPDGRTSIRTYARAFDRDADHRPRIGLVIGNIGLFAQHSEEAIARLPGAVTLAFSPYALRPEPLLERARARGMEVLVALPLEPAGFGQDADPGDRALLTGLSAEENLERLDWALSRIQGQVGAVGALGRLRGERFAANTDLLATMQTALTARGLLYVDPRPGAPTPAHAFGRTVDLVLDDPSETRREVERRLVELEAIAKHNGNALGLLGNPAPFFTAAILAWSAGLEERGAVLVPITVLLRRPGSQAAP